MKSHIECKKCCKCFKKETELESHRLRMHASQTKSEDGVCHTKTKTEICEDCGHAASSRKSLMIHKENNHIEDLWLVNTKRDSNMMNSETESLVTTTLEPKQKKSKINE